MRKEIGQGVAVYYRYRAVIKKRETKLQIVEIEQESQKLPVAISNEGHNITLPSSKSWCGAS